MWKTEIAEKRIFGMKQLHPLIVLQDRLFLMEVKNPHYDHGKTPGEYPGATLLSKPNFLRQTKREPSLRLYPSK